MIQKVKYLLRRLWRLFIQAVSFPWALFYATLHKIGIVQFKTAGVLTSRHTGQFGLLLRRSFYRMTLHRCGKNLMVHSGAFLVYPDTEIGDRCTIEEYCVVGLATIGNDVILAHRVSVMSGAHHHEIDDLTRTFHEADGHMERVKLGDNLWIGTHSVVLTDVSSGTVVAAGSVVTKTFPPNAVIGGVPARLIRMRGEKREKETVA